MGRRIMVCLVLGGCGFQGNAAGDGGAPGDGGVDAPGIDAAIDGPTSCWQRWYNHQPQLGDPAKLMELSTGASERDPWISHDGLRLYFARDPGSRGKGDIYLATRAVPRGPFSLAMEQGNLDNTSDETRAALTDDELTLVLASNRDDDVNRIFITTRGTPTEPFGTPTRDLLDAVNGAPTDQTEHLDPFLTNDGKTLYFAPDPPTSERQHIWFATRPETNKPFGPPGKVPVINGNATQDGDADPALSPDELVIVFSSTRPNGVGAGDLYYATRSVKTANFGGPQLIPGVNSNSDDGDPILSSDGCELYFASTRQGNFDLYVARSP